MSGAIRKKVINVISDQLHVKEEDIRDESELVKDLGADSLEIAELIMSLEEEFDIQIPDEDAEKISKVGDVIKYIEEHLEH